MNHHIYFKALLLSFIFLTSIQAQSQLEINRTFFGKRIESINFPQGFSIEYIYENNQLTGKKLINFKSTNKTHVNQDDSEFIYGVLDEIIFRETSFINNAWISYLNILKQGLHEANIVNSDENILRMSYILTFSYLNNMQKTSWDKITEEHIQQASHSIQDVSANPSLSLEQKIDQHLSIAESYHKLQASYESLEIIAAQTSPNRNNVEFLRQAIHSEDTCSAILKNNGAWKNIGNFYHQANQNHSISKKIFGIDPALELALKQSGQSIASSYIAMVTPAPYQCDAGIFLNPSLHSHFDSKMKFTDQGNELFSNMQKSSHFIQTYYNDINFNLEDIAHSEDYRWGEHMLVHELGHHLFYKRVDFQKIAFMFDFVRVSQHYLNQKGMFNAAQTMQESFPFKENFYEFIPEAFALDQMAACRI